MILFAMPNEHRYGEQTMAQFRTHDVTKGLSYMSTQQSGQVPMDAKMI